MKPRDNVRNLVLLGSWNSLLFTAQWLNNSIFDGELPKTVNANVLIQGNSVIHRVFDLPHFKLEVSEERLCFLLKNNQDDYYQKLIDSANAILSTLQHTPLRYLGINFVLVEDTDTPFNKASAFYELPNLFQANEILMIKETDHKVRISVNRNPTSTEFDFNFSYQAENTAKAKEILVSGIFNQKYDKCIEYLKCLMEKYNA